MRQYKLLGIATLALCSALSMSQGSWRDRQGVYHSMHGRFGGPVYVGTPRLDVTASLIAVGGGIGNFSIQRALRSTEGDAWTSAEMRNLRETYGSDRVRQWERSFDFAVADSSRRATDDGIYLPDPSMRGRRLAMALVNSGIDGGHEFNAGLLWDRMVSHNIHEKVMDDLDTQYSKDADADYHQISNRLFYDLAMHLDMPQIKLAGFH